MLRPEDDRLLSLFEPVEVGQMCLPNRIVMSPMTRYRADEHGVPDDFNVDYYGQRASAGLVVSESNYTEPTGRLAPLATGLYTPAQVRAWRRVTHAVHAAGGRMFSQLVHCGRVSHPALQPDNALPVAPSAVRQHDQVRLSQGKVDPVTPRALQKQEIQSIVDGFATAVQSAVEAGFDGVELHAGSGFLHHQFLSTNSNLRNDCYGGTAANRCRMVIETIEAMAAVNGPGYVGIKIAPTFTYHDMHDANPEETYSTLCAALSGRDLAYVHVQIPPRFLRSGQTNLDGVGLARKHYDGIIMAAGEFDRYSAASSIQTGLCDLVAFGRRYIANPDLVERFRFGLEENHWDETTFYSPGPRGFVDYPALDHCID